MIWSHPLTFIGLIIIPVAFFFFVRFVKQRYENVTNAFSNEMLSRLTEPRSRVLTFSKKSFLFLGTIFSILILAGPKSSVVKESEAQVLGRDIFVLFDVSESMNAEDVTPNRLSVAKLDVEDLLGATVGDRVGLIAFAGSAQVEIPLTTDYTFFRELLRKIDTTTVRMGGTVIGDAIRLALQRFGKDKTRSRVIVLITDGEDHESLPLEAAQNAADEHVPIFTIAIGSLQGAKIPTIDSSGHRSYKTFDGEQIISKPDIATLKEIARISCGRYYHATANFAFEKVYKDGIDHLNRSELSERQHLQLEDLYQPFLMMELFCFLLYYYLPLHTPIHSKKRSTLLVGFTLLSILYSCSITNAGYVSNQEQDTNQQTSPKSPSNIPKSTVKISSKECNKAPKKLTKRQEVQRFNEAMRLIEEGKNEKAQIIQETLQTAQNREVAGRSNYNLGVETFSHAMLKFQQLLESNDNETQVPPQKTQSSTQQVTNPDDIVATYKKGQQARNAKRQEISQLVHEASKLFLKGTQSKRTESQALENAKSVISWLETQEKAEKKREYSLRSRVLSTPELRLNWLQSETNDKIEWLEKIGNNLSDSNFYREVFNEVQLGTETVQDIKEITNGYINQLQINQTPKALDTDHQGKASSFPNNGADTVQKIKSAENAYIKLKAQFDAQMKDYDVAEARTTMQKAQAQLTVIGDLVVPYKDLVIRLADRETEAKALHTSNMLLTISNFQVEDLYWSKKMLASSINEVVRKAKQITELRERVLPSQITSDPTMSKESIDLDSVFDSPRSSDENSLKVSDLPTDTSKSSQPRQLTSQNQKLLESISIALNRKNELDDLISEYQVLLNPSDNTTVERINEETAKKLEELQEKISTILEEIARPLRDKQTQQNQDQPQRQDGSSKSPPKQDQQGQNSDQNQSQDQQEQYSDQKQDQQGQNSDQKQSQDQQKSKPNDLNEPSTDHKSQTNNQRDEKKGVQPDLEESSSIDSPIQKPQRELSPKEKEVEALIRQVERRQKDADAERRAVRQALKRHEKTGKDW